MAEDTPPAVPPVPVQAETLKPRMNGLVVLELFTSQACTFCPKADKMLDDLSQMENVIALACHVDYFSDKKDELAKPFCSQRQALYQSTLRSGPNYTPQIVINGTYDAVGYKLDEVSEEMWEASAQKIAKISIIKTGQENLFDLSFPDIGEQTQKDGYDIWLATTEKPHRAKNKAGQKIVYSNVVGTMTRLDIGQSYKDKKQLRIAANLKDRHKGFVVFAQNPQNGRIVAAGQYLQP